MLAPGYVFANYCKHRDGWAGAHGVAPTVSDNENHSHIHATTHPTKGSLTLPIPLPNIRSPSRTGVRIHPAGLGQFGHMTHSRANRYDFANVPICPFFEWRGVRPMCLTCTCSATYWHDGTPYGVPVKREASQRRRTRRVPTARRTPRPDNGGERYGGPLQGVRVKAPPNTGSAVRQSETRDVGEGAGIRDQPRTRDRRTESVRYEDG